MLKPSSSMLPVLLTAALLATPTHSHTHSHTHTQASRRQYLNYTGDIMLGALFPVHRKGAGGADCGPIQLEDGFQPLEAMLYTVRQINEDEQLLPGIELGMLAFDTCDNPAYALEQSLDFLKGFMAHFNEFHETDFMCGDGGVPVFRGGGFDQVVAVVGAQSSSVSVQVASMLRLFRVPQVSYMSTSPSLSNGERFPYFLRTVPSDVTQAHAMLEVLRHSQWTSVAVAYSDDEYGGRGFEALTQLAADYGVCFTTAHRLHTDTDYVRVVDNIAANEAVRVVLVFAGKSTTLRLLDAARQREVAGHYVWVWSHAWSVSGRGDGDEEALEGALAIQPLTRTLAGFDEYLQSLTLEHAEVNPWFPEYWRETHCGRRGRARPGADVSSTPPPPPPPERCPRTPHGPTQQRYLHFVRDAVYAVAHALHDLQEVKCGGHGRGLCPAMRHIDGDELRTYLRNVTFNDEGGNVFRFLDGRDGPPRYSVLNFQRDTAASVDYHWDVVGNYTLGDDGKPILKLDYDVIRYRNGGWDNFPTSSCSQACGPRHVQVRERDEACCWRCHECTAFEYKKDAFTCEDCGLGFRASNPGPACVALAEEFIDYASPWAIGAMAVASLGILVTVTTALILWTHSDTPVVKASARELSSLLLLGILASFCVTFVLVARPSPFTCGVARFCLGVCYSLCYAAIVTRTNRVCRLFGADACSARRPRYTSPQSQVVITGLLTSVEVIINVTWLLYVPPSVTHAFPSRSTRLLICEGLEGHSYMVSLLYPFLLIGVSTAYAIKSRKCPGGFNETRHLAFANYTAVVIWLAFVPLYVASSSHSLRIVTLALSLSLSGLVQLGCLFMPKLYIVLFKPEKNTKEGVMSHHRPSSSVATPCNVGGGNGGTHVPQGSDLSTDNSGVQHVPVPGDASMVSPSLCLWRSTASLREGHGLP